MLDRRGPGKTICPSEAARLAFAQSVEATAGLESANTWRDWMPVVREAALELARAGRIQITQRREVVDGEGARGAIRLGLAGPSGGPR